MRITKLTIERDTAREHGDDFGKTAFVCTDDNYCGEPQDPIGYGFSQQEAIEDYFREVASMNKEDK